MKKGKRTLLQIHVSLQCTKTYVLIRLSSVFQFNSLLPLLGSPHFCLKSKAESFAIGIKISFYKQNFASESFCCATLNNSSSAVLNFFISACRLSLPSTELPRNGDDEAELIIPTVNLHFLSILLHQPHLGVRIHKQQARLQKLISHVNALPPGSRIDFNKSPNSRAITWNNKSEECKF